MTTNSEMRVAEVRLLVNDIAACFAFYRDVMGFPITAGDGTDVYAAFDVGGTAVSLFSRELQAAAIGTLNTNDATGGLDRAALVLDVGDVDAAKRELEGRGVVFVAGPVDQPGWGGRVAHLRDPDGTLIELYQQIAMNPLVETLPQGAE